RMPDRVRRAAAVSAPIRARRVRVRGVVQGVGFRPFVYRLARQHALTGWVKNDVDGVVIHLEGPDPALQGFQRGLYANAPPAASITSIEIESAPIETFDRFEIRESDAAVHPTTRVSADLPICDDCLRELNDTRDRRYGYPYINCTNCGPRFSIVRALPYDRPR